MCVRLFARVLVCSSVRTRVCLWVCVFVVLFCVRCVCSFVRLRVCVFVCVVVLFVFGSRVPLFGSLCVVLFV